VGLRNPATKIWEIPEPSAVPNFPEKGEPARPESDPVPAEAPEKELQPASPAKPWWRRGN
jgi:hypothetical protein